MQKDIRYNSYFNEKTEKYRTFFNDPQPGQILVLVCPYTFPVDYSRWGIEERTLDSWDLQKESREFIEYQVRKLRCFLNYTKDLDNDYMPSLCANPGIGLNSAYVTDEDNLYGKETSWVHPSVHQWEDMQKLKLDSNNRWVQLMMRMSQHIVDFCEGDYAPSTITHFAPMDMANAIRGNQLFYDFFDEPEQVHALLDFSAEAIIWMERELRKIIRPVLGGRVSGSMWFPGEAPFFSEDATDLCSPEIYEAFGAQYTQKVLDAVGGAYIHHHAKGWHVHRQISSLKGLKTVEISWDPNCRRPIDHLREVYELTGSVPLMTRCTSADVYEKIEQIQMGRMILMLDVKSLDEAKETVRFIRKHSRI